MSLFDDYEAEQEARYSQPYPMREPCKSCGHTVGKLKEVNGQDTVRCGRCNRHCYNAPRVETGRKVRSISERPDIKPSQRSRILERDNRSCIVCHQPAAADRRLVIAHLISVKEGRDMGMTDKELFDDENLAAMCEECNAGIGPRTINTRMMYQVLRVRMAQQRAKQPEE